MHCWCISWLDIHALMRMCMRSVPGAFGDVVDAGRDLDLVAFVAVACAVGGGEVVEGVGAAAVERDDVVDGVAVRVEVSGLVVDFVAADVAGRLVAGDGAAVAVAQCGVAVSHGQPLLSLFVRRSLTIARISIPEYSGHHMAVRASRTSSSGLVICVPWCVLCVRRGLRR